MAQTKSQESASCQQNHESCLPSFQHQLANQDQEKRPDHLLFQLLHTAWDLFGHQAIAEVFGGKLGLAPKVMHGKQSNINFEAPSVLYQGIEDGRAVMRYHSILIEEMPEDFEVTARSTDDQAIMGIQHKNLPIYGFQYHPESIGTPDGLSSIRNFIEKVVK